MDPFSVIGFTVAGLHACVKALVIISKASGYTTNVQDAQVRTSLILHSLTTWAVQAGLTHEPPKLLVNLIDAPIVPRVLKQIELLFSNIDELNTRYGSKLQPTTDDIDDCDDDEKTLVPVSERKSWMNKLIRNVYIHKSQPWKRLRWVTIDEDKFSSLLDKAKNYVRDLERFLESAKQDQMRAQMEVFFRKSIIDADERRSGVLGEEANAIYSQDSIAAAARFKQMRLQVGITDGVLAQPAVISPSPDKAESLSPTRSPTQMTAFPHRQAPQLQARLLTLSGTSRFEQTRTLAQYDGQTVLVEWKEVTDIGNQLISRRVEQIAALLHNIGPSLHSLQCRGVVKDRMHARYIFVFELPANQDLTLRRTSSFSAGVNGGRNHGTEVKSLRQMFEAPTPSLNTRLSIASTLLETLLNLHTAGWLHKELHSGSVILVRKSDKVEEHDLDLSSYTTYVAGYVTSRADSPGEMTETLRSDGEANLYRHPSLLSNNRQPFRKSFDIFSVGCTLLEIGLWSPLRTVLEGHHRPEDEVPRLLTRHMSEPSVPSISSSIDERVSRDAGLTRPFDLMALRRQLLSIHHPGDNGADAGMTTLTLAPRGKIMNAVQSAMGRKYTSIVEDLLAVRMPVNSSFETEDESVLDLEIRARDVIRSIASAI